MRNVPILCVHSGTELGKRERERKVTRLKLKIYIFTIKHDNIANMGNYVYRMSSGAQLDKMRKK